MARAETLGGFAQVAEAPGTERKGFFRRVADRMIAGQMTKAERVIQDVTGKPAAEVRADIERRSARNK